MLFWKEVNAIRKVFASVVATIVLGVFVFQVQGVSAHNGQEKGKPLTSPLTSPCKPGWGYGDKNHCHMGPAGHHDNDRDENEQEHHGR